MKIRREIKKKIKREKEKKEKCTYEVIQSSTGHKRKKGKCILDYGTPGPCQRGKAGDTVQQFAVRATRWIGRLLIDLSSTRRHQKRHGNVGLLVTRNINKRNPAKSSPARSFPNMKAAGRGREGALLSMTLKNPFSCRVMIDR